MTSLFPSPGADSDPANMLLLAAKADPAFGDELRNILRLPGIQRRAMINSALEAMRIQRADPLLVQAVALLAHDAGVVKMRELLRT
ncbi:MAG: hypothetical protein DUW69_000748 [Verrucomicrobia bacterium]|jgi:hypothetical protein|nr:MAG: hypothetical protein DUW69_000748 [Verrucomicrobiota bacterium]